MSGLIRCRKYVNNVLTSIVSIAVPYVHSSKVNTSIRYYNSEYPDAMYSDVKSYLDYGSIDLIGVSPWLSGMAEPEELYGGPYGYKDYYAEALYGRVIKYEIISNDGVNRSIVLTFTNPTTSTGRRLYGINYNFYKEDELCLTITEGIAGLRDYDDPTNQMHHASWTSFPWITTDKRNITHVSIDEQIRIQGSPSNPFTKYFVDGIYGQESVEQLNRFIYWLTIPDSGGETYEPEDNPADIPDPGNPYEGGGTTEEGGGGGNFSDDSDNVSEDNLPSISAIGTGMATIFTPSQGQLRALANVMWNHDFFAFMQNLVENISDMFTSLAMVPFTVTPGATVSVTWLGFDTAVSLTLASQQYYTFDMGSINLGNDSRIFTSGSALDYSPFSRLGIFLPFIGYQELDIDECRGATLHLVYRVDILSGACVALLKINGNTIYQFTGNCLTQIPITNENMQSLVSDAVNIGIAYASARAGGAAAAAEMGVAEAEGDAVKSAAKEAHARAHLTQSRTQLASATANSMMGMKPQFNKSGAVGSAAAMLAVKQPYLFLTTPRQAIPARYEKYCGFPSNITGMLGDFSGYTVVEDIRLNGLVATSPEVEEIYNLLKGGVII